MRPTATIALALASAIVASHASANAAQALLPVAPIEALVSAIDRGDEGAVSRAYTNDATIVDEFAPFRWTGAGAARHWARDFAAGNRAGGVTSVAVSHGGPRFAQIAGDRAWLVVPATFRYRAAGRAEREEAAWTFVLVRAGGRWRIAASTWAKTADSTVKS